jgi:hypothetical protein
MVLVASLDARESKIAMKLRSIINVRGLEEEHKKTYTGSPPSA